VTPAPARRILFVANDGLGAGHVARAAAVILALRAQLAGRGVPAAVFLATTSEADALLRATEISALRLPSTAAARRQGLPISAYRRLSRGVLQGLLEGFAPELLVVDTFPAGPHLELEPIVAQVPLRALIQRSVTEESARRPEMTTARGLYHLTIAPADPTPLAPLWRGMKGIPPITLPVPLLPRDEARRALGLDPGERVALLNPGGGGDPDALAFAERLRAPLERRHYRIFFAAGPLAHDRPEARRLCPLKPFLRAFDVAFAAAGYNSAHELAEAGVPTALFAGPRPFDDQRGRAARFQKAGLAVALNSDDPAAVLEALDLLEALVPPPLATGGAAAAASLLAALLGA
jgi:UDP-N-acetylglucosamine--N-acetylmuramyl-(pentapeptide) pyrophosphoryl-undecaprenol N-acetylglucosamine transferase